MNEGHPLNGSVRPVPEGVADDGFEQLLEVGRLRGYLTQDDLILVLQSVELTHDVIEDVVERVRAEGIEYVDNERDTAAPVALVEAVAEAVVEALPSELGRDEEHEPGGVRDASTATREVSGAGAAEGEAGKGRRIRSFTREPVDEVMDRQTPRLPPRGRASSYSSDSDNRSRAQGQE